MGKIEHHKTGHHAEQHKAEHHTHHAEHHEHKKEEPSKFSLFRHKVAGLFKDIVEAPPEPVKVPEPEVVDAEIRVTAEESHLPERERKIRITAETEAKVELPAEEEEVDEEELQNQEREEMREKIHEHIVKNLNDAVSHWKETGELGVHLEPPVPLHEKIGEKVKLAWSKMKPASAAISLKLKNQMEEVVEKVASRIKRAEAKGEKVDAVVVIDDEWKNVLKKIESVSAPSERDEIEKIYKQLAGK